jgi:hypothetical protein
VTKLHDMGLRWRFGGSHKVESDLPRVWKDPNMSTSGDDHPIRRQRPAPGTIVPPGTVVHLEDECTVLRFRHDGRICID